MKNTRCPDCGRIVRSHRFRGGIGQEKEKIQIHYKRKGDWMSGQCPGSGKMVH